MDGEFIEAGHVSFLVALESGHGLLMADEGVTQTIILRMMLLSPDDVHDDGWDDEDTFEVIVAVEPEGLDHLIDALAQSKLNMQKGGTYE